LTFAEIKEQIWLAFQRSVQLDASRIWAVLRTQFQGIKLAKLTVKCLTARLGKPFPMKGLRQPETWRHDREDPVELSKIRQDGKRDLRTCGTKISEIPVHSIHP
jgi:hypothetical protein